MQTDCVTKAVQIIDLVKKEVEAPEHTRITKSLPFKVSLQKQPPNAFAAEIEEACYFNMKNVFFGHSLKGVKGVLCVNSGINSLSRANLRITDFFVIGTVDTEVFSIAKSRSLLPKKKAIFDQSRSSNALGLSLRNSVICGDYGLIVYGTDARGMSLHNAKNKSLIYFENCQLDGCNLINLHQYTEGNIAIVNSRNERQVVSYVYLSFHKKSPSNKILLKNISLVGSFLGDKEESSTITLLDSTDLHLGSCRLSHLHVGLEKGANLDEISHSVFNSVSVTAEKTVFGLNACEGDLSIIDSDNVSITLSGDSTPKLTIKNSKKVSIYQTDPKSLSVSLIDCEVSPSLSLPGDRNKANRSSLIFRNDLNTSIVLCTEKSDLSYRSIECLSLESQQLNIGTQSSLDLSLSALNECEFKGVDFSRVIVDDAVFTNCDLRGSTSIAATKTTFKNCNLSGVNFARSSGMTVTGENTVIKDVVFQSKDVRQTRFFNLPRNSLCSISESFAGHILKNCVFEKCSADEIELKQTSFESVTLNEVKASAIKDKGNGTTFKGDSVFTNMQMSDFVFEGITFSGKCQIDESCILNRVHFANCSFQSAVFWPEKLKSKELVFTDCTFGQSSINRFFPWHYIKGLHNCTISGCTIDQIHTIGVLDRVKFSACNIECIDLSNTENATISFDRATQVKRIRASEAKSINLKFSKTTAIHSISLDSCKDPVIFLNGSILTEFDAKKIRGGEVVIIASKQSSIVQEFFVHNSIETVFRISNSTLKKLQLNDVVFNPDSEFKGVKADGAVIDNANLFDLESGRIMDCCLSGSRIKNVQLKGNLNAHCKSALNITGSHFINSDLVSYIPDDVDESWWEWRDVDFTDCRFDEQTVISSNDESMPHIGTSFTKCLFECSLSGCIFKGCDFKGANFNPLNTPSKVIIGTQFDQCLFNENTDIKECTFIGQDNHVFKVGNASLSIPLNNGNSYKNAKIEDLIINCVGGNLEFKQCNIRNLTITGTLKEARFDSNCVIDGLILKSESIEKLDIRKARLRDVHLEGGSKCSSMVILRSIISSLYFDNWSFNEINKISMTNISEMSIGGLKPTGKPGKRGVLDLSFSLLNNGVNSIKIEDSSWNELPKHDKLVITGDLYGSPLNPDLEEYIGETLNFKTDRYMRIVGSERDWNKYVFEQSVKEKPFEALKELTAQSLDAMRHQTSLDYDGLIKMSQSLSNIDLPVGAIKEDTAHDFRRKVRELQEFVEQITTFAAREVDWNASPECLQEIRLKVNDLIGIYELRFSDSKADQDEPLHISRLLESVFEGIPDVKCVVSQESFTQENARIFIDRKWFVDLLKRKILDNIVRRAKVMEVFIKWEVDKDLQVIEFMIWDESKGFGKKPEAILGLLNGISFESMRGFAQKHCTELRMGTFSSDGKKSCFRLTDKAFEITDLDEWYSIGTAYRFSFRIG